VNLSLRLGLRGECHLDGQPAAAPVDLELVLTRWGPRRFALQGELCCPALGDPRRVEGEWTYPDALSLRFETGLRFQGRADSAARALLGRSLWAGPLTRHEAPLGSLRLRLDLRRDWLQILSSVSLRARAW
jgi:hypothetical protein